ncbi:MAG: DUF4912 domain-containing protein, partial [Nodosilinea sp.]
PSAAAAWAGKGQALMQMGRQSEGQTCLEKAAALDGEPGPSLPGGILPALDPPLSGAYDSDVPLDLQQMVLGLPSADVEISSSSPNSADVPPALAAEAASLPSQAESAATVGRGAVSISPLPITPGPVPTDNINPGPLPPSTLEEELLSRVSLGSTPNPDLDRQELPPDSFFSTSDGATAIAEPPLRPAPVPVPPPVPVEPGDYVPPPPEAADVDDSSGLEGLPPEVVAALAGIPPSSPDSFGVEPASTELPIAPAKTAAANSWIRLSVDRESNRFYAVWQIDPSDRNRAKDNGGETMTLRLYDVTGRSTQSALPPTVAEQRCRDDFAQDWYLPIPQWDRIYVVEVGYLSATGDWQAIAQSAEVAAVTA